MHSVGGTRADIHDHEHDIPHNSEDPHEMAAFMRMFMDLVGIFNEDQVMADGKIPTSGVCFQQTYDASHPYNQVLLSV